ncbi:hypothetical protein EC3003_0019 [Escherichia coli 3003]|nr:hypothetical protein EC3003_0019 [Escherichia coli 3003]
MPVVVSFVKKPALAVFLYPSAGQNSACKVQMFILKLE